MSNTSPQLCDDRLVGAQTSTIYLIVRISTSVPSKPTIITGSTFTDTAQSLEMDTPRPSSLTAYPLGWTPGMSLCLRIPPSLEIRPWVARIPPEGRARSDIVTSDYIVLIDHRWELDNMQEKLEGYIKKDLVKLGQTEEMAATARCLWNAPEFPEGKGATCMTKLESLS